LNQHQDALPSVFFVVLSILYLLCDFSYPRYSLDSLDRCPIHEGGSLAGKDSQDASSTSSQSFALGFSGAVFFEALSGPEDGVRCFGFLLAIWFCSLWLNGAGMRSAE
jgi:hypothetical protein